MIEAKDAAEVVDFATGSIVIVPALVPDGIYRCKYLGYKTKKLFGNSPKVLVEFEIVEGDFAGTLLERWYPVRNLKGNVGVRGGFVARARSDLVREFAAVTGEAPSRFDRISFLRWKDVVIDVETRTTKTDSKRRALPESCWYSVVGSIVGVTQQ